MTVIFVSCYKYHYYFHLCLYLMKVNMPFCILILAMIQSHIGLPLLTSVALGVNQYKALPL